MSIGNHTPKFIYFDFVELRFAAVLRLPRPHWGAKKRVPEDELGAAKSDSGFYVHDCR